MALFMVHPWTGFFTGMLVGCWAGVVIGCGVALLLVGRRVRQLEAVNELLRTKLRSYEKPRKTGTGGPPIIMPISPASRSGNPPLARAVRSL